MQSNFEQTFGKLPPFPFIGPLSHTAALDRTHPFPSEIPFIEQMIVSLEAELPGVLRDYIETIEFLISYSRRSEQTFNGFRGEVERFLLWSWLVRGKSLAQLQRSEVGGYFNFCLSPPKSWVGTNCARRFALKDKELTKVDTWRPFRNPAASGAANNPRKLSQNTLQKQYSVLNVYFAFLMEREHLEINPIPMLKRQSPHLIVDAEPPQIKRLSLPLWNQAVRILENLAAANQEYERCLFIVVTLKSLYLRISEISERPNWLPLMGHFFQDKGAYWLTVFGKGNKKRRVSVPDAYIPYLRRYRQSRGLLPMPVPGETEPLVHNLYGPGGVSSRHASRLVKSAIAQVSNILRSEGQAQEAAALEKVSSHWFRHTGASIDIGSRPLKHISDDLGHATIATTDRSYVQSDLAERGETGRKRSV